MNSYGSRILWVMKNIETQANRVKRPMGLAAGVDVT